MPVVTGITAQIIGDKVYISGDVGIFTEGFNGFQIEDLYHLRTITYSNYTLNGRDIMWLRELCGSGNKVKYLYDLDSLVLGEDGVLSYFLYPNHTTDDTQGNLETLILDFDEHNPLAYPWPDPPPYNISYWGKDFYLYPLFFDLDKSRPLGLQYLDYRSGGFETYKAKRKTPQGRTLKTEDLNQYQWYEYDDQRSYHHGLTYLFAYCKRLKDITVLDKEIMKCLSSVWFEECPQLQRIHLRNARYAFRGPFCLANCISPEQTIELEDNCEEDEVFIHFFEGLKLSKFIWRNAFTNGNEPRMVINAPKEVRLSKIPYSETFDEQSIIDSLSQWGTVDSVRYYYANRPVSRQEYQEKTTYLDEQGTPQKKSYQHFVDEFVSGKWREFMRKENHTVKDSTRLADYVLTKYSPFVLPRADFYFSPRNPYFNDNCVIYVHPDNYDFFVNDEFWGQYEIRETNDEILSIDKIANGHHQTSSEVTGYYSLDGRCLAKPQKGLNIVRMSDGTSQKIYIQ